MSDADFRPPDPASAAADGYKFDLTGGHTALDFANTLSRREDPAENQDYLTDYGRLVSFAAQTGLITAADAGRLRSEAGEHPRAAVAALRRAAVVREAVYGVLKASALGERVSPASLDALNAELPGALGALRIESKRAGFGWRFAHGDSDLTPMLAPVVRAAAELLTSADLQRVRECDSGTCFWLFLDTSKSGTRRWCDMKVCGNREKARRHHRRVTSTARKSKH